MYLQTVAIATSILCLIGAACCLFFVQRRRFRPFSRERMDRIQKEVDALVDLQVDISDSLDRIDEAASRYADAMHDHGPIR
jgi:hypothetical protein